MGRESPNVNVIQVFHIFNRLRAVQTIFVHVKFVAPRAARFWLSLTLMRNSIQLFGITGYCFHAI